MLATACTARSKFLPLYLFFAWQPPTAGLFIDLFSGLSAKML
jgi:hypothetical protein